MSDSSPTRGLRPPSPRTPAAHFLEALQARVYGSLGWTAEDCQWREWIGQQQVIPARLQQMALALSPAEFERYRRDLLAGLVRDEVAPRPTPYERPHQYSILRELQQHVERAVERLGLALPTRPLIGTLPTRLLEPLMVLVPASDEVVIVVDGQLLTYAHQLAKAVAQALVGPAAGNAAAPGDDGAGPWPMPTQVPPKAAERFTELMLAVLSDRAVGARPYLPDPSYEAIATGLCDSMELFVLAREYAHLVEGDHRAADTEAHAACGEPFQALRWTAAQELRADALGLAIALVAATDRVESLGWVVFAVDVWLASFAILDRALPVIARPPGLPLVPGAGDAHEHRRELLRQLLGQWQGGERLVAFADALRPVIDQLGDAFEASLYEVHWATAPIS